jgi:hypothetical protein
MYGGCTGPDPLDGRLRSTEARSQQLMAMAAAEAADIPDVDQRLTRQLNLADKQIARGWSGDAKSTLAACRRTLGSPESANLNEHARLSGWVSASELSRSIEDKDGAASACESAVADLEKLPDPATRCQYVMGVSNELMFIKGKDEAGKMLAKSGPWTKNIDDVKLRRQAVVSFATALFNLDEYPAGQAMLKNEGDASWRSDMLATLAMQVQPRASSMPMAAARTSNAKAESVSQMAPQLAVDEDSRQQMTEPGGTNYFGKNLRYRDVYQNQLRSQTGK